jgi:NAD(P)-dependent dehydrogenase (short-subunit alcohol dehydrogenase family)
MTMTHLTGKHALVTGGGSGIGAAIAFALAQAGASVTICGRRLDELEFTAERHPGICAQAADVTDEASVGKLYQQAQTARGKFAIVVANAGTAESAPAEKISRELWSRILDVNLTGAFLSVQPALAGMREQKWGRIIFIASTAGLKGYPYVAPYVAAKHGVVGLSRALAVETAKAGITVNAICPGFTETSLLDRAVDRIAATTKVSEDEARKLLAARNPQDRFIQPQEVADAALWLCSDGSAGITGQAISVSGGETW